MAESNKDIANRAALDQAMANVADLFPLMWRRLYLNCKLAGFSDNDSLELVKSFIESGCRK